MSQITLLQAKSLASTISNKLRNLEGYQIRESIKISYPQGCSKEDIEKLKGDMNFFELYDEVDLHRERLLKVQQLIREGMTNLIINDPVNGEKISISTARDVSKHLSNDANVFRGYSNLKQISFSERSKNVFVDEVIVDTKQLAQVADIKSQLVSHYSKAIDEAMNSYKVEVEFAELY